MFKSAFWRITHSRRRCFW